jgi:hypothetical protein
MLNRTIIIARVNKQGKEVYYITFISNFNGPMKKLSVIGILFDQSGNQTLMHVSCCWLGAFLNVEFYRTYLLTSASNTRTLLAKFYAQNFPPTPLQMGKTPLLLQVYWLKGVYCIAVICSEFPYYKRILAMCHRYFR